MPSLRRHLRQAAERLDQAAKPGPRLEAEVLLAHVLGRDRAYLYAHPELELTPELAARYGDRVERRAAGEPRQYLTGAQEFCGREFRVTPAVLIPRPETELVVAAALEHIPANQPARVLDVGTGSGCIAVTLALERPLAAVTATDISAAALAVARDNAARLGASQIQWHEGDLLAGLAGPFDLIVSNPPYISETELPSLAAEVRDHEPRQALVAGPQGEEIYRRLIPQAERALSPGGWLVLELGYTSTDAVAALLDPKLWNAVEIRRDWQDWPRVCLAQRKD